MQTRDDAIQVVRASASTWATTRLILKEGEFGYEKDTGRVKIGDGDNLFANLQYFLPRDDILELIQREIAKIPGGGGGADNPPFEHRQVVAQTTWTIDHTLGYDPVVIQVFDDDDVRITDEYSVQFLDSDFRLRLGFDTAIKGRARLR